MASPYKTVLSQTDAAMIARHGRKLILVQFGDDSTGYVRRINGEWRFVFTPASKTVAQPIYIDKTLAWKI